MAFSGKAVGFILTADRTRSKAFYRDVMGFSQVSEDDFGATFDMGGLMVRISDIDDHKGGPHPVLGWDVPDMDEAVTALVARGVTFAIYEGFGQDARGVWTSPDGQVKVAWFHDPDGNALSLSQGA